MLTLWSDIDRALFPHMRPRQDALRSFERIFDELSRGGRNAPSGHARMHLANTGEELVFTAELPGVSEENVELTVHNDVLSLRVERHLTVPEGMRLHRRERRDWTMQRSISLPVPVDNERTKAVLKDGVLTVRMAVAPEHEPKKITVSAI